MPEPVSSPTPTTKRSLPALSFASVPRWVPIVAVIAVGGVVWLAFSVFGGGTPTKTAPRAPAAAISETGLRKLAEAVTSPIYWIGPQAGITYELTKTTDGRFYIRYLPAGVPVGTDSSYLTIGTYPLANAYGVTKNLARESGSVEVKARDGAAAFYSGTDATNIYLAYPSSNYQIEVFDPSSSQALALVRQGAVKPVVAGKAEGSTRATATATTPSALGSIERRVGHTIYWAGVRNGVTYELSQTGGSVYLRYLPKGVHVGSTKPYLTIGSYPLEGAYATTLALAKKADAVRLETAKGEIAFFSSAQPTNVYLAFKASNVQVEVYDPTASVAQKLVSSAGITAVK